MRRSKKSSLLDLPNVSSEIEEGEVKTITYKDHEYSYRVDKYSMYKDYYAVVVSGGQYKGSVTTTCKKSLINVKIKGAIKSLQHK